MKKQSFILDSPMKRKHAMRLVDMSQLEDKLFEFTIRPYAFDRSLIQNALHFHWLGELEEQAKKIEEFRGYKRADFRSINKLDFGVPILQADEDFNDIWSKTTGHLSYEYKLKVALLMPITSIMKVKQMTSFLSDVRDHWEQKGFELTTDDDRYNQAMGRKR